MRSLYDEKIAKYDTLYKGFLIITVVAILIGVVTGALKVFQVGDRVDENVQQTQQIIKDSQAATEAAREANKQRQLDLTNYVKCLSLLRFDNPELGPQSTRMQVESALDKCAKS